MFTLAQQSHVARRLIALAAATSVAVGSAGSLLTADDAHAMPCAVKGSYVVKSCEILPEGP